MKNILEIFKRKKDDRTLSFKESRAIIKSNFKITREFEKKKKARVTEDFYLTQMKDPLNALEIENLHTYFFTDNGVVKSVNGITFEVPKNKIVGLVGESGCGKSVTSLSIMQLVQAPQGQIVEGEIRFNIHQSDEKGSALAYNIAKMPTQDMYRIRGKDITMIFQEPMTSLNPVFTIGYQLDEVVLLHNKDMKKEQAKARSIEMLNLVGIPMPEEVYKRYPHQLSGGMRQRVMIAMALAVDPKLIIADEPTTALDVTIQAQILELLRTVQKKTESAIILITHDLGVIAEMVDYVVVMYAGRIVEKGTVEEIFAHPLHPYTRGLQRSKPMVNSDTDAPLYSIPGNVPNPINMPTHCFFKDRCEKCIKKCEGDFPKEIKVTPTHSVYCHLYNKEVQDNE
ncbi:MAG: ABC transporter ATP-binding protein [Roseburia sp.]|nr:ABC transporter ATP-binding protein [Anaeroplasma bactoclasticum]MCM1195447.1 ABC transporter ATP-binding protein [Roseburia sp.]MCM1555926.1 ABC transporter ATP-binding protein [Anaeroplasma bactoclasticum]